MNEHDRPKLDRSTVSTLVEVGECLEKLNDEFRMFWTSPIYWPKKDTEIAYSMLQTAKRLRQRLSWLTFPDQSE
jgi:hypothetical protein